MAVTDGQDVNAAVTNAAFISRTEDSSTVAKVDLQDPSTTDLIDAQRVINEALDQSGLANQAATDATSKTYSSNNVVANGDNQKVAIGKLDAEYDTSTGHDHDGVNSKSIDAGDLGNTNNLFGEYVADQFTGAAGTSDDVSANFAAKSSGGDSSTEGVITSAPGNYVHLIDDADGSEIVDGSGRRVFGRLTEAAGTWTLTYFVNISATETSHSLASTNITFFYREVFNQNSRPTIPADLGLFDSVNAVSDIPDASPTQAGKVSTGAQSFAGVKEFNSNPTTSGSDILSTDNSKVVTNKDVDGGTASNTNRITVPKNTRTNLDALTRKEGTVVYSTDEQQFLGDNGTELAALGGGGAGGGLDVFFLENFEDTESTDLVSGNSSTPFDTGTLQGTLANEEATQLSGDRSIKYTHVAGSLNDWFHVATTTVDEKNRGKFVAVIFNAKYDGDSDDMSFIVWDETNSKELASVPVKTGDSNRYVSIFGMPTNTTQVKIGFQVDVANTSSILLWDDTELSLNAFNFGEVGQSEWIDDGTVEITATTGNPTKGTIVRDRSWYQIDGPDIVWMVDYEQSVAGTAGTGVYLFTLPAGLSADTNVIDIDTDTARTNLATNLVGNSVASTGAAHGIGNVKLYDATHIAITIDATNADWVQNGNFDLSQTVAKYSFQARIPIANLSNKGVIQNGLTPENSSIRIDTSNGHGSTNTKIARYTNIRQQIGNALTLTQSATDGDSITVNEDGVYSVSASYPVGSNQSCGISLNSTELTTNVNSITTADRLQMTYSAAATNVAAEVAGAFELKSGDVLRVHTQGSEGANTDEAHWTVTKIGTFQKTGFALPQVAYLRDEKAANTVGGTGTGGSFVTRTLNTSDGDDWFLTLSSNQFTLIPGKYIITASSPAFLTDRHKIKLRNITDSTDDALGSSEFADSVSNRSQTRSTLKKTLSISASKTYEIQHRIASSTGTRDFGVESNMGVTEIYTEVEITKVE